MAQDASAPQPPLGYDIWKLHLRKDCELQNKLLAFDNMGDYALRLLWEHGLDPSIEAITAVIKDDPYDGKIKS